MHPTMTPADTARRRLLTTAAAVPLGAWLAAPVPARADEPAAAGEPRNTVAGVTFEPRITLGGQALVLNGAGGFTRAIFTAYVAALYLTRRVATAEAAAATAGPKRIQMRMFYDVPMPEFIKALHQGFERNQPPEVQQRLAERLRRFDAVLGAFDKVRKGDTVFLDFLPGDGLQFSLNGKRSGEAIPGEDFYAALLHVFIGAHVSNERLRAGLLGRNP